jgi:hypothetical protein
LVQAVQIVEASGPVTLDARWEEDSQGYYIKVRPVSPNGMPLSPIVIDPSSSVFAMPSSLRLIKQDGSKRTEVPVTIERRERIIKIRPAKPDTLANHVIQIDNTPGTPPRLILNSNGASLEYSDGATVRPLNPADDTTLVGPTQVDASKLKLGDGFASLLGGAGGAVLSGKLDLSLGAVFNDQLYLKAKANADISLGGTDPAKYFNSIVGEINATYVFENKDYFLIGRQWPEIGLVVRIESDRDFETMNGTLGLGAWITIDNAVTRAISKAVYVGRRAGIDPPNPAPAVWLSYDYVGKLINDDSGSVFQTSNNRFKANFYWPLWIAHGWNLTGGIINSTYSIRFVADVTPIYDLGKGEAFFEEKVSLELMPETKTGKLPTFVFTYANGKAAPTFNDVNTILAGIKLPW